MLFNKNKTHLGGCNRNKNFPNNRYEGYRLSYTNNKQKSECRHEYRTWKYGMWIDMELS